MSNLTPINEWTLGHEEGVEITLPSGRTVKMKPVALDTLLFYGSIPDLLSSVAAKMLWDEIPAEDIGKDLGHATDMAKLVNIIVPASLLYPKVFTGPDTAPLPSDHIRLSHIGFADKFAIFQVAIQPAEVLINFRNQQIGSVEAVSDSKDDTPEAK